MRLSIAGIVSALAVMASAYTQPDYSESPTGNAILTPGLNEIVPAGKPYSITWNPTTTGTISLVLLRGPSTNVVPIDTLADSISNTGSFVWTPSTELEPDTTHYGLLLVVEGTGQYQYSTQFGISNPDYEGDSSSSTAVSSTTSTTAASTHTATATTTVTTTTTTTTTVKTTTTATAVETSVHTEPTTTTTTQHVNTAIEVAQTTTSALATASAAATTTLIKSATSSSVIPSGTPASSTPSTPIHTGAAGRNAISFGAVAIGVAAVLAF